MNKVKLLEPQMNNLKTKKLLDLHTDGLSLNIAERPLLKNNGVYTVVNGGIFTIEDERHDIKVYMSIQDFEIIADRLYVLRAKAKLTMSFITAIKSKSDRIRRAAWPSEKHSVRLVKDHKNLKEALVTCSFDPEPYSVTLEDVMAEDWFSAEFERS